MRIENPYHEGEIAVQRQANEADEALRNGRAIADAMVPGAMKFVGRQPMAIAGTVDREGDVSAHLLTGAPGFIRAINSRRLELDATLPIDDLRIGLLLIEFASRRRLRINGRMSVTEHGVGIEVDEAYPNCPKYIQKRHLIRNDAPVNLGSRDGSGPIPDEGLALIRQTDTFFVASHHPLRGVDASHRGGRPGFVRIADDGRTLRVPDYSGNSMFNTFGNFATDPRTGLIFLDLQGESGDILQLNGRSSLILDGQPEPANGGTGRWWEFISDRWQYAPAASSQRWELLEPSPLNPPT